MRMDAIGGSKKAGMERCHSERRRPGGLSLQLSGSMSVAGMTRVRYCCLWVCKVRSALKFA